MLSFIGFLFYFARRSRHCAFCAERSIKSQMVRGPFGAYFCNAACKADGSMESAW